MALYIIRKNHRHETEVIWKGIQYGAIGVTSLVLKTVDEDLAKRYLLKELSQLTGLGHKMGQLLTLRLGKTEWEEFAPEPVPMSWIKARIDSESPKLASMIIEIDPKAFTWLHWGKFIVLV